MISDGPPQRVLRSPMRAAIVRDLVRVAFILVLFAVIAMYLIYYTVLLRLMFFDLHMNDFGKFYYSAKAFMDGLDMYGPTPATAIPVSATETQHLLNMNPPHFHLLVLPFAALPPLPALLAWWMASIVALILSLRLIGRELAIQWTPRRVIGAAVGVLLCAATGTTIVTGQLTFLLMLPVTLAWSAARHNRWNYAAAYLGFAASVKPFLGIFWLYLLVKRRLNAAAVMAVAAAVALALGLAVFGWSTHVRWLDALSAVNWIWLPMNGSIAALVARGFDVNPFFTPAVNLPEIVTLTTTLVALPVAAFTFVVMSRDSSNSAVDRTFAGLLLTAQLISPLGWVYYLWLVAGPVTALVYTRRLRRSVARDTLMLLALPGLICPLTLTMMWREQPWAGLTIGSVYTWTTLVLWAAVMLDWRVRSAESPSLR